MPGRSAQPLRTTALVIVAALAISFGLHAGLLSTEGPVGAFAERIAEDAQQTFPRSHPIAPVDLGDLFLRDELERTPFKLSQARERWQSRTPVFARIGALQQLSPRERIHRVITELVINDHLSSYTLAISRMSGFLIDDPPGGNCEAETRTIIAALQAARIDLTGDDVLGVQVFDDHIQPVILDRRHQTVWVLLDGTVERTIRAPIYHPSLLSHALLIGRGATPRVRIEELLLAAPPSAHSSLGVTRGFATDSRSTFPKAGVRSTPGAPPAHGSIRVPPSPTALFAAVPSESASSTARAPNAPTDIDATVNQTDVKFRPRVRQEDAIGNETCTVVAAGALSFRDPADATMFNQLPTYDARARFVLEVAFRGLDAPLLEGSPLEARLATGDTPELRTRLHDLHVIVDAVACAREAITSLAVASKIFAGQIYESDEEPFASLAQRADTAPRLEDATRDIDQVFESIRRDPARFVARLSRLSHDTRASLLTLLPARDHAHVIAPTLRALRVEAAARDLATENADPREWIEIDLDTIDTSHAADLTTPPTASAASIDVGASRAPATPNDSASAPGAIEPLSIDAFLDLLMFWVAQRPESLFEGLPVEAKQHWTESVEATWQQRKRKAPRREQLYVDHLASLLNALPTKAPHPLPSRLHGSDAPRAVQRCVHRGTLSVVPEQAREDGR